MIRKVAKIMDEQSQYLSDDNVNKIQRERQPVTHEAFERLRKFREERERETNGLVFEDSTEILRQEREKRTRHLMQAVTGQYDEEEEENTPTEQNVPDEARKAQRQRRPVSNKTLERFDKISEEIMQSRDGKLFEDSTEMIRQMREERSQELEQL